jgi:hypothetical protein
VGVGNGEFTLALAKVYSCSSRARGLNLRYISFLLIIGFKGYKLI